MSETRRAFLTAVAAAPVAAFAALQPEPRYARIVIDPASRVGGIKLGETYLLPAGRYESHEEILEAMRSYERAHAKCAVERAWIDGRLTEQERRDVLAQINVE